jgi:hypothetical protein
MNIIKSPQHSGVNAYFNMIFNLNQHSKAQQHVVNNNNNKTHTKTFFMQHHHQQQHSQRSSSYKENGSNRNSRNQRMFNHNSSMKTINQSGKTFSQTKTLFTRSVNVNANEQNVMMLQRGKNNVNDMIMNMYHYNVDDTKGSFNYVFHNNNKQYNNMKIQEMMIMKNNNFNKGRIMIKTLNGFNVDSSNRLIIMNAKNKKNKNI